MYILTNNNEVFIKGETIKLGKWENDPDMDTYKIENSSEPTQYAVADFEKYEVTNIPDDFVPNKYCYTPEQGFYLNPRLYNIPDETYQ